jgi:hypothetical protein
MPARLETAVATAMLGVRDSPVFADAVRGYRSSFKDTVEHAWPAYGLLTYGKGTSARLDELNLDRKRVQSQIDIPFLTDDYAVLAFEQSEKKLGQAESVSEEVRACLEALTGEKNPAPAFQYICSRRRREETFRETHLRAPEQEWKIQYPELALVLGRDSFVDGGRGGDSGFLIDCGVIDIDGRPARGCRRAKNFPSP